MVEASPTASLSKLYKYTKIDAVQKILESGKLQWKCPRLFNDPFDVRENLEDGIDREQQQAAFLAKLQEYVLGGEVDRLECCPTLRPLMLDLRQMARRDKSASIRYIYEQEGLLGADTFGITQERQKQWEVNLLRTRALCVSEIPDQPLMWSHYADEHRGVVLGLSTQHKEALLSRARRVSYSISVPAVITEAEWIAYFFKNKKLSYVDMLDRLLCCKSQVWAYEREWRVLRRLKDDRDAGVSLFPFGPNDLVSVYFGCRSSQSDIDRILSIVRNRYPNVELGRYEIVRRKFEIRLAPLKT